MLQANNEVNIKLFDIKSQYSNSKTRKWDDKYFS